MRTAAFILLILSACALAQTTRATIEPALLEKLNALDTKAAAIKDLSAKFEQQKITPLLKKPLTSRGSVSATRDVMLWTTDAPTATRMRVDDKALQLLYVEQKVLEVYPVQGKLGSLAANPLPRLSTLMEQFEVTGVGDVSGLVLRLTPRDAKLGEHVDHVIVELDQERGVVKRFELTDPDGERTIIRFEDYKLNVGLTAEDLSIRAPADARVVHPLERSQ
ncbi:MAG: outer membrane lipoprotein carrier protein LolA [Burkholderiales bacterium]|nr:outer membrane lipoprotein carrier protein LolA [Phycisphaerae bacterium]